MTGIQARRRAWVLALCGQFLAVGCASTVDSVGYDDPKEPIGKAKLLPLVGPDSYPNPFRDLLGKSELEIEVKVGSAFQQLFHGNPDLQSVYTLAGSDQAYIIDYLHGDIRTEGMGFGMMIAVQLDKQTEFDYLWTYAKSNMLIGSGARKGYFMSFCDAIAGTVPCVDPYGYEQFVMALIFAHDRWGGASNVTRYGDDALELLRVSREKEKDNGGVVEGVTNLFDPIALLPYDLPQSVAATYTRPAVAMPGYYVLWSQATGDPFWIGVATNSRTYLERSANSITGLWPVRASFNGMPLPGNDSFQPEGYRALLNLVTDVLWTGGTPWEIEQSNRLLRFFYRQGIDTYGTSYSLDGTVTLLADREPSLIAMNGALAAVATTAERKAFVQAVWNRDVPSGHQRYYGGLLHLFSLMVLGGKFQVR